MRAEVRADFRDFVDAAAASLRRQAYDHLHDWDLAEQTVQELLVDLYPGWGRRRSDDPHRQARLALVERLGPGGDAVGAARPWAAGDSREPPLRLSPDDVFNAVRAHRRRTVRRVGMAAAVLAAVAGTAVVVTDRSPQPTRHGPAPITAEAADFPELSRQLVHTQVGREHEIEMVVTGYRRTPFPEGTGRLSLGLSSHGRPTGWRAVFTTGDGHLVEIDVRRTDETSLCSSVQGMICTEGLLGDGREVTTYATPARDLRSQGGIRAVVVRDRNATVTVTESVQAGGHGFAVDPATLLSIAANPQLARQV